MITTEALVTTTESHLYLDRLCKHWGHKFEVAFDTEHGVIPFDEERSVELFANDANLHIIIKAPDADTGEKLKEVVVSHLNRFAFREQLTYDWSR